MNTHTEEETVSSSYEENERFVQINEWIERSEYCGDIVQCTYVGFLGILMVLYFCSAVDFLGIIITGKNAEHNSAACFLLWAKICKMGKNSWSQFLFPKKLSFSFNNCHLYQKYTHYYHTNLKFLKLTTKKKFLTDWSKRKSSCSQATKWYDPCHYYLKVPTTISNKNFWL